MIPDSGTGGPGIGVGRTLLSSRPNAGNLRNRVGLAATRSVLVAALCIVAMVGAVNGRECLGKRGS